MTDTPRLATPQDLPAVQAIAEAAYAPYIPRIGRRPAPMDADFAGHQARGELWALEDQGALAGYVVCVSRPDHLLLDNVAVGLPGRGHGARLIAWAEDLARTADLPCVRLYTNVAMTENLGLYPHLGYRRTHEAVENGFHRVYFEKPLT